MTSTGYTAWCNALVSAIRLELLMGSGRTAVVRREGIRWHTDVVRARRANGPGSLTNTVGVCTVIARDGAVFKTCTLVAGTADGVGTPGVGASI